MQIELDSQWEDIKAQVARRFGPSVGIAKAHISTVRTGDTVFHDGEIKTVGPRSIHKDQFMGWTLFGDSYVLGRRPVVRLTGLRG